MGLSKSNNPVYTRGKRKKGVRFSKRSRLNHAKKASKVSNSLAIQNLQKQVNRIRLNAYGAPQKSRQLLKPVGLLDYVPVYQDAPLLINLSNLYAGNVPGEGCPVYQKDNLGNVGEVGYFNIFSNAYWNAQNVDIPDTGQIYFNGMNFKAEIEGRGLLTDAFINFTTFTQKKGKVTLIDPLSGDSLLLPSALRHLEDMCHANSFNKSFFKTYHNNTLYLNSRTLTAVAPANVQRNTTGNIKYETISMQPRKLVSQTVTNPAVGGDPQPIGQGWSESNMSESTPLWLLISSNKLRGDAEAITVKMYRTVYWRDSIGSGI